MEILEYDQVDPLGVLELNLLSLSYALTPDRVAAIRRSDPRALPFFGVYAVEDGIVAGQVLVYCLPAVTLDGPEEVGGVAAVCAHPACSQRGIAARLLYEAHQRLLSAGIRFSTLPTARHRIAHLLYQRVGYADLLSFGSAFARLADLARSPLSVERAGLDDLAVADQLFERLAAGWLGFARRHVPFFPAIVRLGDLEVENVWFLREGVNLVGYAIANLSDSILAVSDLLLEDRIDPASAVIAIAGAANATYVQARINQPAQGEIFRQAGFQIAQPAWGTFMIKPLWPDVTVEDARRMMGVGSQRFLISWLDTT